MRGVYRFPLYVRSFVCPFITFMEFTTKFFTELRGSFSNGVYLTNHSSESIHILTIGTLEGQPHSMTPEPRVHARGGGDRGQNLGHLYKVFF